MTNESPDRAAAVCQPEDAEVRRTPEVRMRLLLDAPATGGSVSTLEVTMGRGADGAVPHYHTKSDELFYVAEGELQVMAGDRIVTVGAGGAVSVPRFMPHAFGAAPESSARILIALMPGVERFAYFRVLERLAAGEVTPTELIAAQEEFDNYFVEAPRWLDERNANRQ
ncbi:cupin domain-containing protein [Nocardia panacis]|uniref:Cupin domain-containing protein n=1 Tax=Nocardia panacis TaxID=2340916 RepID=A0A3A4JYY2_9NOCA|nr:cupin domain-containing protein [Nocardia panacis]RJO68463.1 cupin domain-containing protein [Nocardia panacis]